MKGGDIVELQEIYESIQNLRKENAKLLKGLEKDLADTKVLVASYRKLSEEFKSISIQK